MNDDQEQQGAGVGGMIVAEGIEKSEGPGIKMNPRKSRVRSNDGFLTFEVPVRLSNDQAESASHYNTFYTANMRCFFIEARARFSVAGGSGAQVRIEKLKDGVAEGSGTNVLAAAVSGDINAFDLTGVANRIQWKIGTISLATLQLGPGDALALRSSGTLTNARNLIITCLIGFNEKDIPTGVSVSAVLAGL